MKKKNEHDTNGHSDTVDPLPSKRPYTKNNILMSILTLILTQKLCTTQQDMNNTNTDSFTSSYQQIEPGFFQTFVTATYCAEH
jgi:hypothetical protein